LLNVGAFAPEVGRYYDAQLAVSQAESDTLATELTVHPDQFKSDHGVQALATIREGLAQTLIGLVTTFPAPGLDAAWIQDREKALMAIAPSAARFLEADSRKRIAAAALQVADGMTDPPVKDGLTAFAKAISP
jgi:hypothetical protein